MDFRNKHVLIVGLGTLGGGVGTAAYFAKQGAQVTITDLKTEDALFSSLQKLKHYSINYVLGNHRIDDFFHADLIVKNPAVPSSLPELVEARKRGVPIEMAESLFMKLSPTKDIIGVTGTRGKSTTSAMVYEVLKSSGGNVYLSGNVKDNSTLSLLENLTPSSTVVLELSSWQLESFGWHKLSPHIAVVTNLYPDHLNRYVSMDEYADDKKNIIRFQNEDDYKVLNTNDPNTSSFAKVGKGTVIPFSSRDWPDDSVLSIPGDHNKANAAAGLAVSNLYDIQKKHAKRIIISFKGLPYRLETVGTIDGITFINDSTSTTPVAGIAALKAFAGKSIILIAGGNSKKIPLESYVQEIVKRVKKTVVFDGTAFSSFKDIKEFVGPIKIGNIGEAVAKAYEFARPGDTILFSPGVTHLPVYNEFERGDLFNAAVSQITQTEKINKSQ